MSKSNEIEQGPYVYGTGLKGFFNKNQSVIIALFFIFPIFLMVTTVINSYVNSGTWIINTALFIIIFFIASISLDLEVGSMGLPNFGKVAFIAIGAYLSILGYTFGVDMGWDGRIVFPVVVVLTLIISGIFGYLVSLPAVNLRADYFAIVTISAGEIIRLILLGEKRYFWQPDPSGVPQSLITNRVMDHFSSWSQPVDLLHDLTFGIINSPKIYLPLPWDSNFYLTLGIYIPVPSQQFTLALVNPFNASDIIYNFGNLFNWQILLLTIFIIIALLVYLFVEVIRRSPYGRTLRAIRDDDITVISVGKDVAKYRSQITTIAGVICGLAGILYAMQFSSFEHGEFRPLLTFQLFVFVIIGGLGNSKGVLFGTAMISSYLIAAQATAVKQIFVLSLNPDTIIQLPVLGNITILGDLLRFLQLSIDINADSSRFVIMGLILIIFLLYLPSGIIPEAKTDNRKYLKYLTADERKSSDEAVLRRQSESEKQRLAGDEEGPDIGDNG